MRCSRRAAGRGRRREARRRLGLVLGVDDGLRWALGAVPNEIGPHFDASGLVQRCPVSWASQRPPNGAAPGQRDRHEVLEDGVHIDQEAGGANPASVRRLIVPGAPCGPEPAPAGSGALSRLAVSAEHLTGDESTHVGEPAIVGAGADGRPAAVGNSQLAVRRRREGAGSRRCRRRTRRSGPRGGWRARPSSKLVGLASVRGGRDGRLLGPVALQNAAIQAARPTRANDLRHGRPQVGLVVQPSGVVVPALRVLRVAEEVDQSSDGDPRADTQLDVPRR